MIVKREYKSVRETIESRRHEAMADAFESEARKHEQKERRNEIIGMMIVVPVAFFLLLAIYVLVA